MIFFVYSGFRTFPNEIMRLTEGEQKVIFAFMEKAKNERKMPIAWKLPYKRSNIEIELNRQFERQCNR